MTRPRSLVSRFALLLILVTSVPFAFADDPNPQLSDEGRRMAILFEEASEEFDVPVELLQAIAYTESRWVHRRPDEVRGVRHQDLETTAPTASHSHHNVPSSYGVMGLRDDDHFGHSLLDAAALIGRSPEELKDDARLNIRGAAALLAAYGEGKTRKTPVEAWEPALERLSGIPEPSIAAMHTFDMLNAIRAGRASDAFLIRQKELDLVATYGAEQYRILSAPRLTVDVPSNEAGEVSAHSTDYGPAIWDPAASCNYSSRNGAAITHVTIHTIQGSYAGAISWFKNCSASVSAHYVIRSSDGQVTQMVREADKAWHVGSENPYTVGIEHEGYVSDPARWYTTAMYNSSSALTRDICNSRGIDKSKTYNGSSGWNAVLAKSSYTVKGHVNYPNQSHTDPGSGWDWVRYKNLVVGTAAWSQTVDNTTAGRFTASANWGTSTYSSQRYGADYRYANPVAASDAAWYKFNLPATASYEVQVWYPANTGYNAETPFVLATSSGNVTRVVNQQVNGGTWVSLGTYTFAGGDYNAVGVSRWTNGVGYVIADAVRMIRR